MVLQIKIEKLRKKFKEGFSLDLGSFCFHPKTTSCIFGANGAGKSTLFQLMTGNLEADSGFVSYSQERMSFTKSELKRKIGYLPQEPHLPKWTTALELMNYMSHLYKVDEAGVRVKELLSYWDCIDFAKRPLGLCSHGMQKRVGLALASLHDPGYLILDEPFSGLDLLHTYALEKFIQTRNTSGKVTVLSTHITPYAANLCSEAFILKSGKMVAIENWGQFSYEEKLSFVRKSFLGDEARAHV